MTMWLLLRLPHSLVEDLVDWLCRCSHVMYMSGDIWKSGGMDSTGKDRSFGLSRTCLVMKILWKNYVITWSWHLLPLCTRITVPSSILIPHCNLSRLGKQKCKSQMSQCIEPPKFSMTFAHAFKNWTMDFRGMNGFSIAPTLAAMEPVLKLHQVWSARESMVKY